MPTTATNVQSKITGLQKAQRKADLKFVQGLMDNGDRVASWSARRFAEPNWGVMKYNEFFPALTIWVDVTLSDGSRDDPFLFALARSEEGSLLCCYYVERKERETKEKGSSRKVVMADILAPSLLRVYGLCRSGSRHCYRALVSRASFHSIFTLSVSIGINSYHRSNSTASNSVCLTIVRSSLNRTVTPVFAATIGSHLNHRSFAGPVHCIVLCH